MGYSLKDLDAEEIVWLRRLADGRVHVLPTAMAERLQSLGIAIQDSPDVAEDEGLGTRINDDGLRLLAED
ncbi:hypothetical protein OCK02_24480 [Rhizobium sp. TRM96647]|uniref:hypothetical protein n=1 Tax=unclassified Rhizobium TaxID=2613769 RepID=UPI0021E88540|nr:MULTISPECIES: hypothetical protein [unclassified Rhizobium]MCV3739328.1 hypothetical protein [Rhizobium sp. TRM96647]MCV3760994.1 hypothetical protein [Rhizobium sp. TRM96650]